MVLIQISKSSKNKIHTGFQKLSIKYFGWNVLKIKIIFTCLFLTNANTRKFKMTCVIHTIFLLNSNDTEIFMGP